jgi:hypothetical protein
MPFDDAVPKKTKGVKINNENSSIPSPRENPANSLDEKARTAISRHEAYQKRAWELASRLKAAFQDKTLQNNKSPIAKDLEQEVLNSLTSLFSEMNVDEDQPEGIGGIGFTLLAMKMSLIQRDIINELSYKLELCEKNVSKLQSDLDKLSEKK